LRTIGQRRALASGAQRLAKRAIDVTVGLVMLLLALPVMLAIALLVVLESPGPVFYRADRVGYRGRPLRMLKFRKMPVHATGPALTTEDDPRLTRVGSVLARTRLDELPQLWHVLRGDMSLVGPRPEDPRFVARYRREYLDILRVRPGITGWTQLAFAREARILPAEDPLGHYVDAILPRKVVLDNSYALRRTFGLDLRIAWFTVLVMVLRRSVTVDPAMGRLRLHWRSGLVEALPTDPVATSPTATAVGAAGGPPESSP
jgi:lipopolysaccharide/colanic/teichoic acid biosynthesis glycosyltransferase